MIENQHKEGRLSKGFTLIEIIVTVAIIGIVIAFVGINISRNTDRLAVLEAKRFHAIINEIRDESIIVGADFILSVDDDDLTYRVEMAGSQSKSFSDDGLLGQRGLEPGVEIVWKVFEQFDDSADNRVLITSLGEITPFDIAFVGQDNSYHVFVNDKYQLEQRIENSN